VDEQMSDIQNQIIVYALSCIAGVTIATLSYRGLFKKDWEDAIATSFDRAFFILMFAGLLAFHGIRP
jgi:prolipoprotein diacylglyceryltransferase